MISKIAVTATGIVALLGAAGAYVGSDYMSCGGTACSTAESSTIMASATSPTITTVAEREAASYDVDPVHSTVHFSIRHAGVSRFVGRFDKMNGNFTFDPASPSSGSFSFEIPVESVNTGNDDRNNHLRSPDFFNARQFPKATFTSTSITKGDGENIFELKGDLSLHGETRPITAKMEWIGVGEFRGKPVAGTWVEFEIKRTDFGMTTYVAPDGGESGGLGNTVSIYVSIEGKRN